MKQLFLFDIIYNKINTIINASVFSTNYDVEL